MKLIVYFVNREEFVNIEADRLVRDEQFFLAYLGDRLVGAFDVGAVTVIYLSSKKS